MIDVCAGGVRRLAPSAACSRTAPSRSARPPRCCTTARIFEGIKAYRHADGSIHTFDPTRTTAPAAQRRLALRTSGQYFIQSLRELIAVDGAWVPSGADQACTCGRS